MHRLDEIGDAHRGVGGETVDAAQVGQADRLGLDVRGWAGSDDRRVSEIPRSRGGGA